MDVTLRSPHSVNECRQRIRTAFDGELTTLSGLRDALAARRKLLGRIDGDRITMRVTGPSSDSFPRSRANYHPTFRGRIASRGTGAEITGTIRDTSTYLRLFSFVWLGALLLFFLPVTLYAAFRNFSTQPASLIGPLICVLMIIVGWSYLRWLAGMWRSEADYLVSVLSDAIDAPAEGGRADG